MGSTTTFARYLFASAALDDLLDCLGAASGADVRGQDYRLGGAIRVG